VDEINKDCGNEKDNRIVENGKAEKRFETTEKIEISINKGNSGFKL